jgi:hypothetical protein
LSQIKINASQVTFLGKYMLTGPQIPQYEDSPESWDRFLYKAAKGSSKASDILQHANCAYMASLTGDKEAPSRLDLAIYSQMLHTHFAMTSKPQSYELLCDQVHSAKWIAIRSNLSQQPHKRDVEYAALWSRNHTTPQVCLFHDALIRCYDCWSVDWLERILDKESGCDYNSLNVVAAMILLALTWKTPSEKSD